MEAILSAAQAMESQMITGIRSMLASIGRDPDDEGVVDTPKRVIKAFREMTSGYQEDPYKILGKVFDCHSEELIIVRGIDFVSLCEHHLLPFTGTATVAYLPDNRVVGLSKIPRLVECFAKRLQLQEQLTRQIAQHLYSHPTIKARGAACIIEASHSCMSCRGVRKAGARMITSSMLGEFRDNPTLRNELLFLRKGLQ